MSGGRVAFTKGAPEVLLAGVADRPSAPTRGEGARWAEQGLRVLGESAARGRRQTRARAASAWSRSTIRCGRARPARSPTRARPASASRSSPATTRRPRTRSRVRWTSRPSTCTRASRRPTSSRSSKGCRRAARSSPSPATGSTTRRPCVAPTLASPWAGRHRDRARGRRHRPHRRRLRDHRRRDPGGPPDRGQHPQVRRVPALGQPGRGGALRGRGARRARSADDGGAGPARERADRRPARGRAVERPGLRDGDGARPALAHAAVRTDGLAHAGRPRGPCGRRRARRLPRRPGAGGPRADDGLRHRRARRARARVQLQVAARRCLAPAPERLSARERRPLGRVRRAGGLRAGPARAVRDIVARPRPRRRSWCVLAFVPAAVAEVGKAVLRAIRGNPNRRAGATTMVRSEESGRVAT